MATRELSVITVDKELRTRDRQQSAVTELGQMAIRSRDLDALLGQAAILVAEVLGTDSSSVMSFLPSGQELLLRAGVGWTHALVGHHTTPAGPGSSAGFVLRAGDPLVVLDLPTETSVSLPPVLLAHHVVSLASVVIRGPDHPWGLLAVHTMRPRAFATDDVGFLQSVANVLSLAIERHEIEAAQRRETETLATLFDNMPVMLALRDRTGRLLRVNREWERTLGWTLEEAQTLDLMTHAYPDLGERREALARIESADRKWAEFRPRTRDGRVIDVTWMHFDLSDGVRIGFGLDVTETRRAEDERNRLLESVRAGEARLKTLSRKLLTAHEAERRRVARELHDELGQSLTAVKINLQALERSAGGTAPLTEAIAGIEDVMHRVRDIALDLRPSVLDDLGLSAALRWYVDRFARDTRLTTQVAIDALPHLDSDLETACFRVAQEALTNVVRHAQARRVWLHLHMDHRTLELTIRDDGQGFDLAAARQRAVSGGSMGLLGMQERMSLIGGAFTLETHAGGTAVHARFPLPATPAEPA